MNLKVYLKFLSDASTQTLLNTKNINFRILNKLIWSDLDNDNVLCQKKMINYLNSLWGKKYFHLNQTQTKETLAINENLFDRYLCHPRPIEPTHMYSNRPNINNFNFGIDLFSMQHHQQIASSSSSPFSISDDESDILECFNLKRKAITNPFSSQQEFLKRKLY